MRVKTVVVVAMMLFSTGCGGDGPTDDLNTPTVRPRPTPTATSTATFTPVPTTPRPRPTSAALSAKQAANVFVTAVRPRNLALAKFDADLKASAPVDVLRQDAIELLAAERQFLAVLDRTAWPESILENVESLANCIATSILWYDVSTRIKQPSDVRLPPTCGGSDAQLIRLRLEVPSY
ncbi:hypothetical protein [Kribbella sp. NPDC023855]|uniref:hypothetical protein n=1 Tax=Kribbella sp. NPDC023855 TaxID=3154698 RepID=UPI0033FDAB88